MNRVAGNRADRGAGSKGLVRDVAERLRELIFAREPGVQIGSLPELARDLGVGIVTVQQAARILEHEGLLEVRRGPGGGYYASRPDAADLERALAAWMRSQRSSWEDALDMTSLLFNELCAAAAGCEDRVLHDELRAYAQKLSSSRDVQRNGRLEQELQDILFRMVNRPLFELLTRVTLSFSASRPGNMPISELMPEGPWLAGRRRIIDAILHGDVALARFEANRSNREVLLRVISKVSEVV